VLGWAILETAVLLAVALGGSRVWAEEPNRWVRLEKAQVGPRSDPALVYDGAAKRFLLLGGGISWRKHTKPRPYDDLALDLSAGLWENLYPPGKKWGPRVGLCNPPPFKNERWGFGDREGNLRPNVATYRGVYYYNQHAYSPDHKRVFFFARGSTFSYDPAARTWRDLKPASRPDQPGGPLLWGSMCYDPVNKKALLFGGGNVMTERGDPGTWLYDPASSTWTALKSSSAALDGPRAKCAKLVRRAKRLAERFRARHFRAELPEDRKVDLPDSAFGLAADIAGFAKELQSLKGDEQETRQLAWAIGALRNARRQLRELPIDARRLIVAADCVASALAAARDRLAHQPPQRALSPMVYDPATRRIVLLGGDQLDRLLADTWAFDCASKRWLQMRPPLSPEPRAGHALVYLPKSKKVLLFGGFTYTSTTDYCGAQYRNLPFEMWTYDGAANRWTLFERTEDPEGAPRFLAGRVIPAAAGGDDWVVAIQQQRYERPVATWVCRVDPAAGVVEPAEGAGAADGYGVGPGTVTLREGPFVPLFYDLAPQPDPAATEARLKALPANTWTRLEPPRRPNIDRCWGTAVYSPDHDVIMHWSGGHSSHCGTEVIRYHPGINRWSLATACELPLEFTYSNDGTPGQWSFQRRPWMTGHTYRSYGCDPVLQRMLFAGKGRLTYFFDPASGDWEPRTATNPFRGSFYTTTIISTPRGAVAWAQTVRDSTKTGLWRMDATKHTWQPLPLKGRLPRVGPDRHGAVYDSKRERLLLFSEHVGDVTAYDLKAGEARLLNAAGKESARVRCREAVYVPECDMVLLAAHVKGPDGKTLWPVYRCGKNAWYGAQFAGTDPVGKRRFNVSLGLSYDARRQLVWALGQRGEVTVLRFDATSARLHTLK